MSECDVGPQCPGSAMAKQVFPQEAELLFTSDAAQQYAVPSKHLGFSELQSDWPRVTARESGVNLVPIEVAEFILPAQGYVRRNQGTLDRIEFPSYRFEFGDTIAWYVHAQLPASELGS